MQVNSADLSALALATVSVDRVMYRSITVSDMLQLLGNSPGSEGVAEGVGMGVEEGVGVSEGVSPVVKSINMARVQCLSCGVALTHKQNVGLIPRLHSPTFST